MTIRLVFLGHTASSHVSSLHPSFVMEDNATYLYTAASEGELVSKAMTSRMWANAQRDGRPAEYRWRPLFNAAKFG